MFNAFAADKEPTGLLPMRGMASVEFGRLEEAFIGPTEQFDKEFLQQASGWLFQDANLSDDLDIHVGLGVMTFSVVDRAGVPNAQFRRMVPVLAQAKGVYTLGGRLHEATPLRLEVGLFPFKYNSYATNLGEYMFRSRVMPIQVRTGGLDVIETAGGFLTGFHADGHLPAGFHWDAFYTVNMDRVPLKAQSLTFMMDYKYKNIFETGFGVQFENMFFDREELLSPEVNDNMSYKTVHNVTGAEKNFNVKTLGSGEYTTTCRAVDAASCTDEAALGQNGSTIGRKDVITGNVVDTVYRIVDSAYYSFAGTKVVGRAALNFQSMLQFEWLNPKDLSIYAEAILMGLDKVPVYGETTMERLPIMFGINLPTFKLLDLLSLEFELFKLKYPMSDLVVQGPPELPNYEVLDANGNYSEDDWKFSLMAKKTVVPGLEIFFQVARDHMRTIDFWGKDNFYELTQRKGKGYTDWGDYYWLFRFKYYY